MSRVGIWRAKVRRTGVDVQATPGRCIWIGCRFRSTTCKRAPVPCAELQSRHSNANIRGRQVSAWHYIKVPSSPQLREPLSGNAATTAALPKPALSTTALQRQNRPQAHHQHCYCTATVRGCRSRNRRALAQAPGALDPRLAVDMAAEQSGHASEAKTLADSNVHWLFAAALTFFFFFFFCIHGCH